MSAIEDGIAIMARVGQRARWVIWGCIAFLLTLVALISFELPNFLLGHPQIATMVPGTPSIHAALAELPLWRRGALFAILLMSAAPFLWALAEAAALARLMATGDGFSPALPARLNRIGWALVLTLISRPLAGMGLTALITDYLAKAGEPSVHRATALAISSDDLGFALIGVAVIALAAIARRIVALAEDARGIV